MIRTALNNLLIRLHLRRDPSQIWEPPTLLDHLLSSPLQYLFSRIYHALLVLRGRPFHPPRNKPTIRVVCLSDTHNLTLPSEAVPSGDLLIHCGDLTVDGTVAEIQRQVDWLRALGGEKGFRHRVVIGGNHDVWFDEAVRGKGQGMEGEVNLAGVEYLRDRMVRLEFSGGRWLNVYGWGALPWCGEGFALQYERDRHPWEGRIPDETDILVTHTPPRHHRDLGLGCDGLLEEVWRVKPKLHVFGHVHAGWGKEAVYYDECQRAYESLMAKPTRGFLRDLIPGARWIEAFNILRYGLSSILWKWIMLGPGTNNGGLMVNAALTYRNTGRLGNPVTVVDL